MLESPLLVILKQQQIALGSPDDVAQLLQEHRPFGISRSRVGRVGIEMIGVGGEWFFPATFHQTEITSVSAFVGKAGISFEKGRHPILAITRESLIHPGIERFIGTKQSVIPIVHPLV